MKRNLILAALTLFAALSNLFADDPSMTKLVVQTTGPKIPAGSFGARPKTFYLAGEKYARVEEELDSEHGIHARFITVEPDIWIVNLVTKTGQHIVDRGPTFVFHAPIIYLPKAKGQAESGSEFKTLEFGKEVEFFREKGARDAGPRQIDGKECRATSIKKGSTEVTLLVDSATGQPYQLDVLKNGKAEISFRYLEYKIDLPFQKSLFEPPEGVKFTEAK